MHKIRFLPLNIISEFESGTTLLDAARSLGIALRADCGGVGTCGKCFVQITSDDSISRTKNVLACRHKITESLTVFVPPESLADDTVAILVDSELPSHQAVSQPVLSCISVSLSEPTREDSRPDMQRLCDSFATPPTFFMNFAQKISANLRQNNWKGKAIVLEDSLVDFVAENDTIGFYAVALDIGTTTLAAELVRLDAASNEFRNEKRIHAVEMNPQKRFGNDIISRINSVLDAPENLTEQHRLILDAAGRMIRVLVQRKRIDPQRIIFVTVSGNTVMQQLFHGINPGPLGVSPFVPATRHYPVVSANELGWAIHPEAKVRTFPILGGFVGGDLVAGILATNMDRLTPDAPATMLIDVGTNGEMILAHKGRLWAAATAAGPAFEGAEIEHGMIASPGAIGQIDFSHDNISIHILGDTTPRGICGSALIDLTAELLRYGVINSRGRFATDTSGIRDDIRTRIVNRSGKAAFRIYEPEIDFTQHDVRKIQLAAGAIRCGVILLLEKAGLTPSDVHQLYLAGGFGRYIRIENARRIGLFPQEIASERIRFCGNTSLRGAVMLAQDRDTAARAKCVADRVEHVDLSLCENFSNVFAESMIFP